jgi:hypothetical protein
MPYANPDIVLSLYLLLFLENNVVFFSYIPLLEETSDAV